MWDSDPSLLREKLQVLSFLPVVGHHARSGVYGKIMSQLLLPTLMWFLSHFLKCSSRSNSSQVFLCIVPYAAVGSVCQ